MHERPRVFFGYPSKREAQRDALVTAARRLNATGAAQVTTWESLNVKGRVIVDQITGAIDASTVAAFDVTELNQNVMFELGYAIGSEKKVWLVRDTTLTASKKKWDQMGLLSTVGYQPFTSSDDICTAFVSDKPHESEKCLYDDLIRPSLVASGTPSIFFIPSLHNTEANRSIAFRVRKWREHSLRVTTADPTESPVDTLAWYAQELLPAAAVVVHFTSAAREFADIHNARSALVAGLALGMRRKLLMLAESDFFAPIDYRDILQRYNSARSCAKKVDDWLGPVLQEAKQQLKRATGTAPRLAKDLREIRLGEHVAENEEEALPSYFVKTVSFEQVLAGKAAVFVGRKGAGKTANLYQAASQLGADPRNLVCVIKPVGYEWESLLRLLHKFPNRDTREYLLLALWKFLLESEIANAASAEIRRRPAGPVYGTPEWALITFLEGDGNYVNDEFAVRLERAVKALQAVQPRDEVAAERRHIAEALDSGVSRQLRELLGPALKDRLRVAVLVDNLDKAWERGADFELLSHFLLALLTSVTRLTTEFQKDYGWRVPVPVTVSVFIRADIFAQVMAIAREPDKIPVTRLAWTSPEMLLRVVEERYVAARSGQGDGKELWEQYFCPLVRQQATHEYVATRVLPRPRDIVFLCNAAITSAVNKRHTIVQPEDVLDAERQYSRFAFEAIQVEDDKADQLLEQAMIEFVGATAILRESDVLALIGRAGVPDPKRADVFERLRSLSFLGIEVADNSFDYSDDPREIEVNNRLALQLAQRRVGERRFKIHPAFRPYLSINDVKVEGVLA